MLEVLTTEAEAKFCPGHLVRCGRDTPLYFRLPANDYRAQTGYTGRLRGLRTLTESSRFSPSVLTKTGVPEMRSLRRGIRRRVIGAKQLPRTWFQPPLRPVVQRTPPIPCSDSLQTGTTKLTLF